MSSLKQMQTEEAIRRLEILVKLAPNPEVYKEAIESVKNGEVFILTNLTPSDIPTRDFERLSVRTLEECENCKVFLILQEKKSKWVVSEYLAIGDDPSVWESERTLKVIKSYTFRWTKANITWALRELAKETE